MAGTKAGGEAAAETNRQRYGTDFYKRIGRSGGKAAYKDASPRGFARDRELAAEAGRRGGQSERRRKSRNP